MLVGRLQLILPSLISPYQNALIKNQFIADNIFLAQSLCKGYNLDKGVPRYAMNFDIQVFDSVN